MKYRIEERDDIQGCGCCEEITYILYVDGENVYESDDEIDCLLGIMNREGIDFNYSDYN